MAVSLLAFVIGLSVESKRVIPKTEGNSGQSVSREEWKQSLKDLQETLLASFKSDKDEASQSEKKDVEKSETKDDEGAEDDAEDKEETDVPALPDLNEDDSKGWREYAESTREKLSEKTGAVKDLEQKLSDSEDYRERLDNKYHWLKIDSQRNAELLLEALIEADQEGRMILDDDILRVHPFKPAEDLFESPIKPTIVRVQDDRDLTRSVIVNLEGIAPSEDDRRADKQWDYVSECEFPEAS